MDLSIFSVASKNMTRFVSRNSPVILTTLGVAGLISTVVLAIKATAKAVTILDAEKAFRFGEFGEETPISIQDTIVLTWKEYVPTVIMGSLTITSMIGATHISARRNAALASLLTIAEGSFREYQEKVAEQIGEKKEEKIRAEILQDRLDAHPMSQQPVILTGKGTYPCYDKFSSRYFLSDIEVIRAAENKFNQKLIREGWLGINEFYYRIGLDPIELGDEFGWIAERALLEVKYDTRMAKDTNEPCLVIDYVVTPIHI